MLHWGLLPQLTTEVVPQGLDIIKTSLKGINTSPMGVHQHTMIIYIRISSEVTNTPTLPLNQEGIISLHSHQHIWPSIHRRVIITESQSHHHSFFHHLLIIDHRLVLLVIERFYSSNPLSIGCSPSPHRVLHHILRKTSHMND